MLTKNSVVSAKSSELVRPAAGVAFIENCITKDELALHLRVSISLINRLMAENGLPHIKIGRAVRFRLDEIHAWFQRKGMKL